MIHFEIFLGNAFLYVFGINNNWVNIFINE